MVYNKLSNIDRNIWCYYYLFSEWYLACVSLPVPLTFFFILVAFAVDPLYHQTSAQFDEGGAKGLLLNNLGVYGNCQVLFDSLEVPGKCLSPVARDEGALVIDLSFASGR